MPLPTKTDYFTTQNRLFWCPEPVSYTHLGWNIHQLLVWHEKVCSVMKPVVHSYDYLSRFQGYSHGILTNIAFYIERCTQLFSLQATCVYHKGATSFSNFKVALADVDKRQATDWLNIPSAHAASA